MSDANQTPSVIIDDEGRPEPPMSADEADTLLGFLDFLRATFEWKTRGLTTEQLRQRLDPDHPSSMTLAGMMKHLAMVEDHWITTVAASEPYPSIWQELGAADGDWDWESALEDSADHLRSLWSGAVQRSRTAVEQLLAEDRSAALAVPHPAWEGSAQVSLRWILTHMVEEYARHNGHADLFREAIDGQTGE